MPIRRRRTPCCARAASAHAAAAPPKAAFGFYEKMFGWTKAEAINMGPMGTYQLFATAAWRWAA
jgi:predicted enzyme related to lactoylglutathione lyase